MKNRGSFFIHLSIINILNINQITKNKTKERNEECKLGNFLLIPHSSPLNPDDEETQNN